MALVGSNLKLVVEAGGVKHFRYDTTDSLTTVEAASYFSRESATNYNDIYVDLTAGDIIDVYVWTTTILTGAFVEKKTYNVTSVTAAGVATIEQAATGSKYSPGGTVTQITNRSTGVTLSTLTGQITTDNTSLAAGAEATFTVTNTKVAATDIVVICAASGQTAGTSIPFVTAVAAGSFDITLSNVHAATADTGAMVINFAVIKSSSA